MCCKEFWIKTNFKRFVNAFESSNARSIMLLSIVHSVWTSYDASRVYDFDEVTSYYEVLSLSLSRLSHLIVSYILINFRLLSHILLYYFIYSHHTILYFHMPSYTVLCLLILSYTFIPNFIYSFKHTFFIISLYIVAQA